MDQELKLHASQEHGWRRTRGRRYSSSDSETILGQAGESVNTESIEKFLSLCLQQFETRHTHARNGVGNHNLKIDNLKVSAAWLLLDQVFFISSRTR